MNFEKTKWEVFDDIENTCYFFKIHTNLTSLSKYNLTLDFVLCYCCTTKLHVYKFTREFKIEIFCVVKMTNFDYH